jgi:cell division protein FtsX
MIDFKMFIQGNGHNDQFQGKVIGFSSRLNTILVPQSFMDWSNPRYAPYNHSDPTRLIMKVKNPADETIGKYLDHKGYEIEDDKLNEEKTTYFLRMIVTMVMIVGLVISVLSFYILMLSIYLLVQKNSSKLENLLLIGYSPNRVAHPYQILTLSLNVGVLLIAWIAIFFIRSYYMNILETLFPEMNDGSMLPAIIVGLCLCALVSLLNLIAIRRKIMRIWERKD